MKQRYCRCGLVFEEGNPIALVSHVTSPEHAERLSLLGIVEHNHSYRWVDGRGRPVDEFHPDAREFLTVRCPACCREAQREFIHDSELPTELCRFIDCAEHGRATT